MKRKSFIQRHVVILSWLGFLLLFETIAVLQASIILQFVFYVMLFGMGFVFLIRWAYNQVQNRSSRGSW